MKLRLAPLVFIVTTFAGLTLALGQTRGGNGDNKTSIASVNGWFRVGADSRQTRVKIGDTVSQNECLYGEMGSSMVVKDADNLWPYSCDPPYKQKACPDANDRSRTLVCSAKIGTKPVNANQGTLSRLGSSLWSRFYGDPDKYMIAASRGLEADLDEAVVPLTGSQVNLSAVFKEMDEGDYWVTLVPVNGNGKSSRPLRLQNKRGMPAFVSSPGISPALYNVILVDESEAPLGNEAWALVRSPDNYAAVSSEFGQAVAASQGWPAEMDPSATRAILRAYLDQLADQK